MRTLRLAFQGELTKAWSLRSTWWSLVVATALSIGLSALIGLSLRDARFSDRNTWDPVRYGYFGLTIGLIVLVVFGVMLVSGEFTSGTIRASLAAVPRRGVFLAAKVLAGTAIALVVAVVCGLGAFLATQPVLGDRGTTLGEPGVPRAVLGACLYLALMAVFAMGVAAMLRSTALCLGIMIPILFLNSQGLANLPAIRPITQFLPDQAGMVLTQSVQQPPGSIGHTDFGWGGALLVLLAWTLAALAGGFVSIRRLDP